MKPSRPRRHARRLALLSLRWQRRLTFVLGGITVGGAAAAMAVLADMTQKAFDHLQALWHYAPALVTPLGFALSVWLTVRYFPNSQGSGIPQAIAARRLRSQGARGKLVSLRIAVGKIGLTLLGLLVGGSVGREGPTVQVGASIMFALGRMRPGKQPGLILAGSAAGVAAAFNTPLAGIVFGIEEMSRSFEQRASGLIISAVIAAGLTSTFFLGDYSYFGTVEDTLRTPREWLAVPVCGVIGGLLGGIFSQTLVLVARGLPGMLGAWFKRHPVCFAALCGVGVAACGIASGGAVYGTGYSHVRHLLDNGQTLGWSFGLLKFGATVLSSASGMPGGLFSPSLAVGAGIGANIAQMITGSPVGPVVVLGMVAYFTGVVQAPITAFVIVTEMTNNHAMLVPLMATALIAYASSRLVCPEGVYHALAEGFVEEGMHHEDGRQAPVAA